MKKIIPLIWLLIFTGSAVGQRTVDYILKARAFSEAGKPELAINILTEAVTETNEYRLFTERGDAYTRKGDLSSAISDYNEANKITPFAGEYGLARVYALKGDAPTALYHLEKNLNSSFRRGEKDIMLDPAFEIIENRSEWRLFWKKDRYSFTEKSISEIEYYNSVGNTGESKEILLQLKKSYPDNVDVIYAEALINLATMKFNEVIKAVSGLLIQYPENEKYLRLLAKAQTGAANPAGASVTYSKLLDSGVADARLYILRADCYKRTGENGKAINDIEKYLEIYPENKTALSFAGKVEAVAGDNIKALEYFSKNLQLHPGDPECYIDRGDSYYMSKSWNWAINDYSMSLDLNPSNSEVWLRKGIALVNSGNREKACHDFRKSYSLGNKRSSEYISKYCIK